MIVEKIRNGDLGERLAAGLIQRFPRLKNVVTNHQTPEARRRLILVTGHRRENFGQGFENICHALAEIAAAQPDVDIFYPVHLNPN